MKCSGMAGVTIEWSFLQTSPRDEPSSISLALSVSDELQGSCATIAIATDQIGTCVALENSNSIRKPGSDCQVACPNEAVPPAASAEPPVRTRVEIGRTAPHLGLDRSRSLATRPGRASTCRTPPRTLPVEPLGPLAPRRVAPFISTPQPPEHDERIYSRQSYFRYPSGLDINQ
jgi:hypothetical protein